MDTYANNVENCIKANVPSVPSISGQWYLCLYINYPLDVKCVLLPEQ